MRRTNLILLGLLLLAGCGVKGALQPKGTSEPKAPSFLKLKQQGDTVQLSWDMPTANQDGSKLTDLAGFRVDLYSFSPDQYCPECKDQETVATIHLERPEPATIANNIVHLRLPAYWADKGVRFRITPFTERGRTGPFVQSRLTVSKAPAAPFDIKSSAIDRGVNLFWALPEGIQENGDLLGVNIYRGDSGDNPGPQPINAQPVKGNNFDDFGLENDKLYHYGLRTVIQVEKSIIESAMSEIAAATPKAGL